MIKDEGNGIILINKQRGETMGQLTSRVHAELELSNEEKITFAGRLDPLAGGLVIYLVGEKRLEKESFLALPKKYEFEIIFGVETDTNDVLGLITSIDPGTKIDELSLRKEMKSFTGKQVQTYPNYSSKPVQGKPLFQHAREGREVELPTNEIEIFDLGLVELTQIAKEQFLKEIEDSISLVRGDFRQDKIKKRWKESQAQLPKVITIASCSVYCSSGTYVRVLAKNIASKLGTTGLARNIFRTHIGEFTNTKTVV